MVGFVKSCDFFFFFFCWDFFLCDDVPGEQGLRAWGVAVAGCSWYRWKEEIGAVRMVPVGEWQWQYWLSCGGFCEPL
jgi:hypothetical protein